MFGNLEMSSLDCIVYVILICVHLSLGTPGWLKVCSSNGSYLINAGGCPKGVKTQFEVFVQCACVNGVWVLSKGDCDPRPYLLVGRSHCFHLENAQISHFKFLGRPSIPFAPVVFMGSRLLDAFWSISSKAPVMNTSVILLQINTNKAIAAKDLACCSFESSPVVNKLVKLCFGAPPGDYMLRSQCFHGTSSPPLDQLALDPGEGMQLGTATNEQRWLLASSSCSQCGSSESFQFETNCCSALPYEDASEFLDLDVKRYDKQTNRIVGAYLDFTLKNKKPPQLNIFEYGHFRMASRLLAKVCPQDYIPHELLKVLLRFFKQAVSESMEDYIIEKTIDEIHNDRITSILTTCLDAATPWRIFRDAGACNRAIVMTTDGMTIDATMPASHMFDVNKLDLIMETAWKVTLFVHYYCSPHFASAPSDAAFLLKGLERFFNLDLRQRWTNPGNSFQVFKFLLSNFNLEKFTFAIDACTAAARKISQVRMPWLPRPYHRSLSKYMKHSSLIWNGTATCLGSYWYPKESYEDTCDLLGPSGDEMYEH